MNFITIPLLLFLPVLLVAQIDQRMLQRSDFQDASDFTQTFVAGTDANLVGVYLLVRGRFTSPESKGYYTVAIHQSTETDCYTDKLSEGFIFLSDLPLDEEQWYYVELSAPIQQAAGDRLAIVVTDRENVGGSTLGWVDFGVNTSGIDAYMDGQAFVGGSRCQPYNYRDEVDWVFQTVISKIYPPLPLDNQGYIEFVVRNRFGKSLSTSILAEDLTHSTSKRFEKVSQGAVASNAGSNWRFEVDLDADRGYGYSLSDIGYTSSKPVYAIMPKTGSVAVTIVVTNDSPRSVPGVKLTPRRIYSYLYPDVDIFDVEAETRYTLEVYRPQTGTWASVDVLDTWQGGYTETFDSDHYRIDTGASHIFRVKAEAP